MTRAVAGARPNAIGVNGVHPLGRPHRADVETITDLAPGTAPWVTVVVPTRNERDNVAPLLHRLGSALSGVVAEVIFVDDSTDDTVEQIRRAGRESGLAVGLLHRAPAEATDGLGGAVVAGFRASRAPWAVVMDADLQHPPELVKHMLMVGQSREVDLVVGTRKLEGGGNDGLDGNYRRAISGATTRAVKTLFPRRLGLISDPMSGLFAVRLAAVDFDRLKPHGFKILLEIAVRTPGLRVAEIPFSFGDRVAGESKASMREGMRFFRQVSGLRLKVLRGQMARSGSTDRTQWLRRLFIFGLVGASGVVVNEAVLWLFLREMAPHYLIGAILATEASTLWNFALTDTVVFRGPKPGTVLGRFVRFALLNHAALLIRLPLLALLVGPLGADALVGNLVTLVLLFLVRFLVADGSIYAREEGQPVKDVPARDPMRVVVHAPAVQIVQVTAEETAALAEREGLQRVAERRAAPFTSPRRQGSRYLPYRYSVGSVLTIGSQVRLPELEYFRAQWVGSDVDLAIRVGQVGRGGPSTRATMTQFSSPPAVAYQEHLGRLGANFAVRIGNPIEVTCSPALARSPHVLYTNVIEALLRFISVSRGVVLLHSACLDVDGRGLLLSARTDTGKTGTVLRMLRDYGARFLSDDMTLIHASGRATCFPKPLTISHHTLRAVEAGDLSRAEWRRLKLQSRLHSKEGRQFGMLLASLNIPIMGINSMTQRVVPPPKYAVDRLVDCRIVASTDVRDLFVIERGAPLVADLSFDEMIDTLITNTDDAYGFPPFRQLAPSIVIGEDDYLALRQKERHLIVEAMTGIRARRIATDDFSWCERIDTLMRADLSAVQAVGTGVS